MFSLRIKLENEPEAVRKRQDALRLMGIYPRSYSLTAWIRDEKIASAEGSPVKEATSAEQPDGVTFANVSSLADFSLLKERLSDCEEHHGESCKHSSPKQMPGL